MADAHSDELFETLRTARPNLPGEETTPDSEKARLLQRGIVAAPRSRRRMQLLIPTAITGSVAIGLAVVIIATSGTVPSAKAPTRFLERPNIKLLAAASKDAFSTTGRAVSSFVVAEGLPQEEQGTASVSFAGNDLEMTIDFQSPGNGRPGFQARNRTVDGEFYLLDGAPGDKHWYHDTNSTGARASDLFNLDPRTLLNLLGPSPEFVTADTKSVNGEEVRHLVAAAPEKVRDLHLGLGDAGGTETTKLGLWVGPDDVVRRLAIEFETTETSPAGTFIKHKDGTVELIADPSATPITRITRSSYAVSFMDIGEDIRIEAPNDPIEVAAKG